MPKSASVRLSDMRAIIKLVGECRDLGDDVTVWREHFFRSLGKLVSAPVVLGGEMTDVRTGKPSPIGLVDVGWENGFNRAGLEHAAEVVFLDPSYHPFQAALLGTVPDPGQWAHVHRGDLVPDPEWYKSVGYERINEVMGTDHTLYCFEQLSWTPSTDFNMTALNRGKGERDFTARERVLAREAHMAVTALIGGPLARFNDPSPSDLPPRAREVLQCLLEGDADKQVAIRLKLTRHTVNQYVKAIYQHFGVRSRPELLALWVQRQRSRQPGTGQKE